jgi:hypothetical protein
VKAEEVLDNVDFIVEYEDGSTFRMSIDSWKLRSGGHAAVAIAAEKQLNGEIPKGKIARVKRATL